MMRDLNRLFEQWIRERPEQWLCIKRAWPRTLEPPARRGQSGPAAAGVEA
jgi:lauroyl/myristoyl acyltransferase